MIRIAVSRLQNSLAIIWGRASPVPADIRRVLILAITVLFPYCSPYGERSSLPHVDT